ncbi:MAG: hypothetical protein IPJ79_08885 [Bacteroidetes bacterium]|nr:hypothetical protein [Bacteroidota bacterium]
MGFTNTGNITVKANNACTSSATSVLAVSARTIQPGTISGNTNVCKSNTSVTYSVAAVTGAISYTWTITGGATFVGSTTGRTVVVKFTTPRQLQQPLLLKPTMLAEHLQQEHYLLM